MQDKKASKHLGINNIARKPGTGSMDPIYYNVKAPHNQPAPLFKSKERK